MSLARRGNHASFIEAKILDVTSKTIRLEAYKMISNNAEYPAGLTPLTSFLMLR